MRQGVQWWVLGSGALMLIGAFGPWVTALGISVAGTDSTNDGWLVVAAAAIGAGLCYAMRRSRWAGVWALLAGIAGLAVTAYDRGNVQDAINKEGAFAQALAHVGWGLNLALIASISMAIAGLVALIQARSAPRATPSSAPPSVPSSPSPTTPPDQPPAPVEQVARGDIKPIHSRVSQYSAQPLAEAAPPVVTADEEPSEPPAGAPPTSRQE